MTKKKRAGVFDPWRQEEAPPKPKKIAVPEAESELVHLKGRYAGLYIWVTPGDGAAHRAITKLTRALEKVPPEVREAHRIRTTPCDGVRLGMFYVDVTTLPKEPVAVTYIAEALSDPRVPVAAKEHFKTLKVAPYRG